MRWFSGLSYDGSRRGDENWLDFGNMFKVELLGFISGLDVNFIEIMELSVGLSN